MLTKSSNQALRRTLSSCTSPVDSGDATATGEGAAASLDAEVCAAFSAGPQAIRTEDAATGNKRRNRDSHFIGFTRGSSRWFAKGWRALSPFIHQ